MGVAALLRLMLQIAVLVVGLRVVESRVHHHVAGDDRGWDPSSDLLSWSSARTFRVGDTIWFAYSAAHENVVELNNMEEYMSCDINNPIKMYTDGLNMVSLQEEGIRYFASGNLQSCKKGLKLHVEVQPPEKNETQSSSLNGSASIMAAGPTPSASTYLSGLSFFSFVGIWVCIVSM